MKPLNSSVCSPASNSRPSRPWAARSSDSDSGNLPGPEAAVGAEAERIVGPIGVHPLAGQTFGAGKEAIDLGDDPVGSLGQRRERRAVVRRQQVGQHTTITTLIVGRVPQVTPRPIAQHLTVAAVVAPHPPIELHADLAADAVADRAELQRHRRPDPGQHRQRQRGDDRRRDDDLAGRQHDPAGVRVDRLRRPCRVARNRRVGRRDRWPVGRCHQRCDDTRGRPAACSRVSRPAKR